MTDTDPQDDVDPEQGTESPHVPADLLELHQAIEIFGPGEEQSDEPDQQG